MLVAALWVWAKPLREATVDAVPVFLVGGFSIWHPGEVLGRQLDKLVASRLGRGLEIGSDQQLQAPDDGADQVRALGEAEYGAQAEVLLRRVVVFVDEEQLGLHPAVLQADGTNAEQMVLASPDKPVP